MFSSKDIFFGSQASGYRISNSLRFRSSASAYLTRTPSSAGNRTTWTWSGWVKRGLLSSSTGYGLFQGKLTSTDLTAITFSNDIINIQDFSSAGGYNLLWSTSAVFRDPSSWYHVVVAYDTTQASSANAVKLYVNGVQQTLTFTASTGSYLQNRNSFVNATNPQEIGNYYISSYFDGYMAEVNFIGGSALAATSFGSYDTNGIWQPAAYTGSYGTNGFYLKFTTVGATSGSNTGYGQDFSGNGNYWTTNNFGTTSTLTTYDSMIDSPTNYADGGNGRGNYCVLNPLDNSNNTLSDANLTAVLLGWPGGSNPNGNVAGSIAVTSGKYYWEATITASSGNGAGLGVARGADGITGYTSSGVYYLATGNKQIDGGTATAYGATYAANDVIGIALDADGGTITFYKQTGGTGSFTSQGSITLPSSTSGWKPKFGNTSATGGNNWTIAFNAGQRPYNNSSVPSGFSALNTQNLPTPTIANGAQYMAAMTYAGDNASPRSLVMSSSNTGNNPAGATFQPDFVWIKDRTVAYAHMLFDSVRGAGSTKDLSSSSTGVEGQYGATYGYLSSFNASGFSVTIGSDAANFIVNKTGDSLVAWQWNAGGAPTVDNSAGAGNVPTAGSVKINGSNSTSALAGSIAATRISANTSAGFSVVTYTGTGANATVGHGLGVAPSMMIIKRRNVADDWSVYHTSIGVNKIFLDLTNAAAADATMWNSTVPTSSVFSVGSNTAVNASTGTYVAYCFAPVAGYSAFGSYTGNGSADGPFVYTGFRPRYVMVKRSDSTGGWVVMDTSRDTYNVAGEELAANTSSAAASPYSQKDFLSNGFKLRNTQTDNNASGGTYIYAAFAENPFKISRAR